MELTREAKVKRALEARIDGHRHRAAVFERQLAETESALATERERLKRFTPSTVEEISRRFKDGQETIKVNLLHQQAHTRKFCPCESPDCTCLILEIDRQGTFLDPITRTPLPLVKVKKMRDKRLQEVKNTDFGAFFFEGDEIKTEYAWRLT